MQGWISLYRKIKSHWVWDRPDYFQAWIDILFMVNHAENKILFDGKLITVDRGTRYTSLRKLSKEWGWSTTKVNTFLGLLHDDGMIELKKDTKKTVIKVLNYNVYQDNLKEEKTGKKQSSNSKKTDKKQSDNTEVTEKKTNNNDNNVNNDNNDNKKEYVEVLNYYKSLDNLPGYNKLTDKRKGHINARLEDYNIIEVKEVLSKANKSEFLINNLKSGWYSFDWIWNPNNFVKIHEDKYSKNIKKDEQVKNRNIPKGNVYGL